MAWGLVGVGVALRLIRYLANRSLWLDEAFLAESMLTYSFRQLATEPLLHWQAAPVGFLFLQKLAVSAFGTSEYVLRLVPLLTGLASVPLFAAIARRCLPPAGALVALAMFVALEPLVYYTAEAKQYSIDVAVALAMVAASQRVLDSPNATGRLLTLATLGAVAIFVSHPSIFMLASAGLLLLVVLLKARLARATIFLTVVGVCWLALFVANYAVFLRPLLRHAGLASYWSGGYMPWDRSALPWLGRALHGVYTDYGSMWLPLPDVAVLATLLGAAWLWRTGRRTLALLTLPILLTLAAAALHRFPFSGRLILFLVPMVILLIGAGVQALVDATLPGPRLVPAFVIAVLLGPSLVLALYYVVRPAQREEMKAVLAHVRDHRQPGDVLYVWNISQVPFRYYRDRFGLGPDRFGIAGMNWIPGAAVEPTATAYAREFEQFRGRGRVWVLLTHWAALGGPDERATVLPVLDRMGTRLDTREAKGAMVILYDLPPAGVTAIGWPPR